MYLKNQSFRSPEQENEMIEHVCFTNTDIYIRSLALEL